MTLTDTYVQIIKTSFGVYHRFYRHLPEDGKEMYELGLLPYKKLSNCEYEIHPDFNYIKNKCTFIKDLELYDSNKQYVNIFNHGMKGEKRMNFDEYGFPIFDDEYENDIKQPEKKEEINIKQTEKEEPKKDKNALF